MLRKKDVVLIILINVKMSTIVVHLKTIFLISQPKHIHCIMGTLTQKNRLDKMVLLSTQNKFYN